MIILKDNFEFYFIFLYVTLFSASVDECDECDGSIVTLLSKTGDNNILPVVFLCIMAKISPCYR